MIIKSLCLVSFAIALATSAGIPHLAARDIHLDFPFDDPDYTRLGDTADSGGIYRIYYRVGATGSFNQLGTRGEVRRTRNGQQAHLHVEGFFGDDGEFFDIDRIYYTTRDPTKS